MPLKMQYFQAKVHDNFVSAILLNATQNAFRQNLDQLSHFTDILENIFREFQSSTTHNNQFIIQISLQIRSLMLPRKSFNSFC